MAAAADLQLSTRAGNSLREFGQIRGTLFVYRTSRGRWQSRAKLLDARRRCRDLTVETYGREWVQYISARVEGKSRLRTSIRRVAKAIVA